MSFFFEMMMFSGMRSSVVINIDVCIGAISRFHLMDWAILVIALDLFSQCKFYAKFLPDIYLVNARLWRTAPPLAILLEKHMKKLLITSALAFGVAFSAQAKDIVDTAVGAGNFTTLAAALKAADLVDTLKGPGPYTVFAPTDAAFKKIPKADLDALLKDKAKLTAVLTYHVVPGKVMAADLKAGEVKTVQGSAVTVMTKGGAMINKSKVTTADIAADNGVIHAIDTVLMPK
jgi:uncharacterized surface protein with fasciclin (FAS1) repeats